MKRQELYRIRVGTRILYDRITEEEYLDKIQTIAEDFYEGNLPIGTTITTEIIKEINYGNEIFRIYKRRS